jgi:hypothetical protein
MPGECFGLSLSIAELLQGNAAILRRSLAVPGEWLGAFRAA